MNCMCIGTEPEFRHGEISHCCTRWEQHLFELMCYCQVHRPMLQLQGVPVDCKLHVKLHIADENLQQPETGAESESSSSFTVGDINWVSTRQVSVVQLLPLREAQLHTIQLHSVNISGVHGHGPGRVSRFGHPQTISS